MFTFLILRFPKAIALTIGVMALAEGHCFETWATVEIDP